MKHTLKAKYAANGLNAHRQRVTARVPEQLRRQRIVDAVTARFNEPARPKIDNLSTATMFSRAVLDSFKRQLARDYAKLSAQPSVYGTRASGISRVFFGADLASGKDFSVITTHTAP